MFKAAHKHPIVTTMVTCSTVCALVLGPIISDAYGGCWIRELVAAQSGGTCSACAVTEGQQVGSCSGTVDAVNEYYRCQTAGTGQGGRDTCSQFENTLVGYSYTCLLIADESCMDWMVGKALGCAVTCAIGIALSSSLLLGIPAAVACYVCLYGTLGGGACQCLSCGTNQDNRTEIRRAVFSRLSGCGCHGG
jgi:hypothetical protein